MSEELKPCPFCGGKAEIMRNINNDYAYIQCTKCLAMVGRDEKIWSARRGNLYFTTEQEAIEAWNRRAEEC